MIEEEYEKHVEELLLQAKEFSDDEFQAEKERHGYEKRLRGFYNHCLITCRDDDPYVMAQRCFRRTKNELLDLAKFLHSSDVTGISSMNLQRSGLLQRMLVLQTVYEVPAYREPEGKLVSEFDDLEFYIAYRPTDEYLPRVEVLKALMAVLLCGVHKARELGSTRLSEWHRCIAILKEYEMTARPFGKKDAAELVQTLAILLDEMEVLSWLKRPLPKDFGDMTFYREFYIPYETLLSVPQDWDYNIFEEDDETPLEWFKRHNNSPIGRFQIFYDDETGLTVKDLLRGKGADEERWTYRGLCAPLANTEKNRRAKVLVALFTKLEHNPLDICRPDRNDQWSKAFIKPKSDDKPNGSTVVAYRFKGDQILVQCDESGKRSNRWRFFTDEEIGNQSRNQLSIKLRKNRRAIK